MKKVFRVSTIALMIVASLILFTACAAVGESTAPAELDADRILEVVEFGRQLITIGVLSSFVMLLINVGKLAGIVKDGTAPTWNMVLSAIVLGGAIVFKVFNPDLLAETASETLNVVIEIAGVLFAFLGVQLPAAAKLYENVRGLPVVGYSNTLADRK